MRPLLQLSPERLSFGTVELIQLGKNQRQIAIVRVMIVWYLWQSWTAEKFVRR